VSLQNQYQNYKEVKAARGIKIAAKDLEKAMAGLPLFVGRNEDEIDYFKNEIQNILKTALTSIKLKENGVHVQASTLGSLEALLEFLKTSNLPVRRTYKNKRFDHRMFCCCFLKVF
jgi:translation initiation factor 5B